METETGQLNFLHRPGSSLWLGLFPFLLLGLMVVAFETPREWVSQETIFSVGLTLMLGGYLLILVGLLAGALAGFPRWVYPYLAYSVLFPLFLGRASTPGLVIFNIEMWGRESWSLRAFVPLAIVFLAVPLLNRQPWRLADALLDGIREDWTLMAFGLYGMLPLFVFLSQDEMEHAYSFPGAVAGMALILLGVFIYLRLDSRFWRTFGLFACAYLAFLAVNASAHLYWDTHSMDIITGERSLLPGPAPYANILVKAVRDAILPTLIVMLPGVVGIRQWWLNRRDTDSHR
jgi:hypothetical protein